jgi:predicted ATP-dependent protease
MVMSEEQKALMRERMEAVRNAKKSKKEAVAAAPVHAPPPIVEPKPKPLPQAKRVPKPIADEVLEKVMPSAPKLKPVNTELVEMSAEADDEPPTPRVAKIPQARVLSSIAAEPKKEKFAKLVFYKEPNAKQQSKLTKILQEEESSDEEKPVIVSKVAPEPASSTESYQQQHEQKIKRMQAMASKFF